MKKFILKISAFFLVLVIVDQVLGKVFNYMGTHANGGYVGHHMYVVDKTDEDILVFGSSRAIHHYNPAILEDSLGMTCYNCGQDGNGIILFYGMWQMIRRRYTPKMIVYEITPSFDLYKGESNQKYLGWLRGDYDHEGVKEIFWTVDPTEKYKMLCQTYRYNSKFLQYITDYVHPFLGIRGNGFLPLKGEMDTLKIQKNRTEIKKPKVDYIKVQFIEKLIDETKAEGTRLVFVISPSWYGTSASTISIIRDLCERKECEFIDLSNHKKYHHRKEFFKDGSHLNALGADEFTRDVARLLKEYNNMEYTIPQ